MEFLKTQSENPLVDNIVYYVKILAFGTVLKDQDRAEKYETIETLKNAQLYITCMQGTVHFLSFEYTRTQMTSVGMTNEMIAMALYDYNTIPEIYRKNLSELARQEYIKNYVEGNEYYRNLNGCPGLDRKDQWVYLSDNTNFPNVDITKPIHEFTDVELRSISVEGILNELREEHPEYLYLQFLTNKVDPYYARLLPRFGVVHIPLIEIEEIQSKFREKLERARVYTLKCIYSEAFKYNSDYYDSFIQMLIKIQTMVDCIIDLPDFIIRRELFDIRSVRYMFESNGVDFFEEIPMKYQIAMLKNLNRLISFKSTYKNIIDICSIFGFDDIGLFKYYILKQQRVDGNGNPYIHYKGETTETGETVQVEDVDRMYDLRFLRVPMTDEYVNYINKAEYYETYEQMTNDDPYWAAENERDLVKHEILKKEFNIQRSKYLSLDTMYDMSKLEFETSYMFNIILSEDKICEALVLDIPSISNTSFKMVDLIIMLYVLNYELNGIQDRIMYNQSDVLSVLGFNFNANMTTIQQHIYELGINKTLAELGVSGFRFINTNILSFAQLMEIYTTNKNVHDHIRKQMEETSDIRVYRAYEYLYKSLMVVDTNMNLFKLHNGTIAPTYTDWLKERDAYLYANIIEIRNTVEDKKMEKIKDNISSITIALDKYVNSDKLRYIFNNIPSLNLDVIKQYVFKVINFFKSYKVEFKSINNIYKFNDKILNNAKIMDMLNIESVGFELDETSTKLNKQLLKMIVDMSTKDNIDNRDKVTIEHLLDFITITIDREDDIKELSAILDQKDYILMRDSIKLWIENLGFEDDYGLVELLKMWCEFIAKDHINNIDKLNDINIELKDRALCNHQFSEIMRIYNTIPIKDATTTADVIFISYES